MRSAYRRSVKGRRGFAQVNLTRDAYRRGLALALAETVLVDLRSMARPAGRGRGLTARGQSVRIPIACREEWVELLRGAG